MWALLDVTGWLFSPVWIIVPICFMLLMMIFMYMMFMRGGRGMPWQVFDREELRGRAVSDTPLEILSRRYASGEITKEDFDQMKNDLE